MFVKVLRRGLMGPSEAVLPTMVPEGCGAAREAAAAAWGCLARAVVACVAASRTKRFLVLSTKGGGVR